jgi:cytochrome c-type biogenesis protein CcmH
MMLRVLIVLACLCVPAFAVTPSELLPDPALEARAREISRDLRCLVCQNQSIDDSDAELARDLRKVVRERLLAGDSNQAVTAYVVSRYGDFVLLRPRFIPQNYVLWLGPVIILLLGIAATIAFYRNSRSRKLRAPLPLQTEERRRLDALLKDEGA